MHGLLLCFQVAIMTGGCYLLLAPLYASGWCLAVPQVGVCLCLLLACASPCLSVPLCPQITSDYWPTLEIIKGIIVSWPIGIRRDYVLTDCLGRCFLGGLGSQAWRYSLATDESTIFAGDRCNNLPINLSVAPFPSMQPPSWVACMSRERINKCVRRIKDWPPN